MSTSFPSCDGIRRRDLLKIGFAGTLGFSLSLPDLLARQARAERASHVPARAGRDVSLIIVYLQGGMSTIDVFDLKPERRRKSAAIFGRSRPRRRASRFASICRLWPARGTSSRFCVRSRTITRGTGWPTTTCSPVTPPPPGLTRTSSRTTSVPRTGRSSRKRAGRSGRFRRMSRSSRCTTRPGRLIWARRRPPSWRRGIRTRPALPFPIFCPPCRSMPAA